MDLEEVEELQVLEEQLDFVVARVGPVLQDEPLQGFRDHEDHQDQRDVLDGEDIEVRQAT